ncbi:hypothetical protein LBMAG53_10860 [Planctomycetota bacterium]|nr:hypothetical protein LBMAG53_10860 [Planctomycetota bacterium]
MVQSQLPGVEQHALGPFALAVVLAIDPVPDHRAAEVGQGDADLVGAPGAELDRQLTAATEALHHPPPGDGFLGRLVACLGNFRGAFLQGPPTALVPALDTADFTFRLGRLAPHQAAVGASSGLASELRRQQRPRLASPGEAQAAAGLAVETVDQADELGVFFLGFPHPAEQFRHRAAFRLDAQRSLVGRRRQHARRFVHHHQVLVLEQHLERSTALGQGAVFALEQGRAHAVAQIGFDGIARRHRRSRQVGHGSADLDQTSGHRLTGLMPAESGNPRRQFGEQRPGGNGGEAMEDPSGFGHDPSPSARG